MDLLHFVTAGSVDDGKSTLIGRLLYDGKGIMQDQLEMIEATSHMQGNEEINLALLTDGLKAEREQGITIDVAYRYFATQKRKFIIADAPGHSQYTRNMVTGASSADLCLVLVDARKGFSEQTKRHLFIADLLRIKQVVLAINKMDLVDYSEEVYEKVKDEAMNFFSRLGSVINVMPIPISALKGDFVVQKTDSMPWYDGPALLSYLENVYVGGLENHIEARFPVQFVLKPNANNKDWEDFRGYSGQIAGGCFYAGDEVMVLPSGFSTKIKKIYLAEQELEEAFAPRSVVITLEDEVDIGRGDMLVKKNNPPEVGQDLEAMICWFSHSRLARKGDLFLLKHTSKEVKAKLTHIAYEIDIETLHKEENVTELKMNALARVSLRSSDPLIYDAFRRNRHTGSFILVDPLENKTLAAGIIID